MLCWYVLTQVAAAVIAAAATRACTADFSVSGAAVDHAPAMGARAAPRQAGQGKWHARLLILLIKKTKLHL